METRGYMEDMGTQGGNEGTVSMGRGGVGNVATVPWARPDELDISMDWELPEDAQR